MANNDSFGSIQAQLEQLAKEKRRLEEQLEARKVEEVKVLADAYARKLSAVGISIADGIAALRPYDARKGTRVRLRPTSTNSLQLEKGRVYKDPAGVAKDYVGGSRGAKPKWLTTEIVAATTA